MLLWVVLAMVTAAAVYAVTRPLHPADHEAGSLGPMEADAAVYRDQLIEIEADRERGLIDASEAAAARAEVARRLIQSSETATDATPNPARSHEQLGQRLLLVCSVVLPLLAMGIYLSVGSPSLPGQPFAGRVQNSPEKASVAELIAKVEARLRDNPNDAQGWDVVGPVYLMQQRYGEAVDSFKRSMALNGESPRRLMGFAQASISAANGIVSEDARRALAKVVANEPNNLEARFWIAVAKEQDGQLVASGEDLKAMLSSGAPDGPWRGIVEDRLREIATRLGPIAGAPFAAALPNVKDAAAAAVPDAGSIASMPPERQAAMIGKMVDGLAERLKANGRDLAGWQKLVRAYVVLGRKSDAASALADARRNFADDSKALAEINALASSLGLGS